MEDNFLPFFEFQVSFLEYPCLTPVENRKERVAFFFPATKASFISAKELVIHLKRKGKTEQVLPLNQSTPPDA